MINNYEFPSLFQLKMCRELFSLRYSSIHIRITVNNNVLFIVSVIAYKKKIILLYKNDILYICILSSYLLNLLLIIFSFKLYTCPNMQYFYCNILLK